MKREHSGLHLLAQSWRAALCSLIVAASLSLTVDGRAGDRIADEGGHNTVLPFILNGTKLVVSEPTGRRLTDQDLLGATIVATGPNGNEGYYRIDHVELDNEDRDGDIYLYTFSVRENPSLEWRPLCRPDARGRISGFPLAGSWDEHGNHVADGNVTITCLSGVVGKCVRLGYKPWHSHEGKQSMWDFHQACTRMMRADYCGNGIAHTRNGTPIDVFDRLGIQKETVQTDMQFEAAWSSDGATCIVKPRLKDSSWSLEDLVRQCPERFLKNDGKVAECSPDTEIPKEEALIFNKS